MEDPHGTYCYVSSVIAAHPEEYGANLQHPNDDSDARTSFIISVYDRPSSRSLYDTMIPIVRAERSVIASDNTPSIGGEHVYCLPLRIQNNVNDPVSPSHDDSGINTNVRPPHEADSGLSTAEADINAIPTNSTALIVPDPTMQVSRMRQRGLPDGLAMKMAMNIAAFPMRFWIVDNSSSMMENDAHRLKFDENLEDPSIVECTRWSELQDCILGHIKLAAFLQLSTRFRMLNDPGAKGSHEVCVADPASLQAILSQQQLHTRQNGSRHGENRNDNDEIMQALIRDQLDQDKRLGRRLVRASRPAGSMRLAAHLLDFRRRMELLHAQLHSQGQQAVLVIATDRLPVDETGDETEEAQHEVARIIKSLQDFPTRIVIRLCTDKKKVVDFYRSMDDDTELNLEVVDDFLKEAKGISLHNPWLNYALPLHRCREMGFYHHVLDLLDERPLTKDELLECLVVIFGMTNMKEAPDIHKDFTKFLKFLSAVNNKEGAKHWQAQSLKKEHWIDMNKLQKAFGQDGGRWLPIRRTGLGSPRRAYASVEI